ncbi:MAG: response regulator [Nitrospira sp.]|nr:response regulator [Nitrospira sp.]
MKHNILVVEDEQDTADLAKRVLEREGFTVIHAKDGRQAATLLETMRPPALVVLDMIIPYVSGLELLSAIRHHPDWHTIPILMVSADHYEPDIQRAMAQGATAYLVKQPGLRNLLQAVSQVLCLPAPASPARSDVTAPAPARPTRRTSRHTRPRDKQRKNRAA